MSRKTTRRAVLAGLAAAPVATVPAIASRIADHPDAELIALAPELDRCAAIFSAASKRNGDAHDAAERATPIPEVLRYTDADAALGLPNPGDGIDHLATHYRSVGDLLRCDHPRAREIVRELKAWGERFHAALDLYGYQDDHPEVVAAYDAAYEIHDTIIGIPAHTLDGLRVKARAAYWARFGEIGDDEDDDAAEAAALSIVRDLLAPQGLMSMTDKEFFATNPLAAGLPVA